MTIKKRWARRRLRHAKLGIRVVMIYLLVTVIPLCVLLLFASKRQDDALQASFGERMPRLLAHLQSQIDDRMNLLASLPDRLAESDLAIRVLRENADANSAVAAEAKSQLNDDLTHTFVNSANPDVLGVYILSGERLYYSSRWVFKQTDWSWQLRRYGGQEPQTGQTRLILPGEIRLQFANELPFVMLKKPIVDADNREVLGSMFIAVDLSFIGRLVGDLQEESESRYWLMNGRGTILYDTDSANIGKTDPNLTAYPTRSGSFISNAEGGSMLVSMHESVQGYVLAHEIPVSALTKGVDRFNRLAAALAAFLFLLTCLLMSYSTSVFIKPLKRLSSMMKNVERGHFDVDYDLQSKDEIGTLARSLNSMIVTLRDLIQKNYKIEIRQKEAELYALQSQINPHFMYNTLESISMAVEEGERDAVVEMVTLLGRMLRFSVSNLSRSVTIAEEMQHVIDYLTIQKFRFEDRLSFDVDVRLKDSNYRHCYTPKFILQPLVENAIKYGMDSRKGLEIRITVDLEQSAKSGKEDIVFRIRDNGPGIAADRLHRIEQSLRNELYQPKDAQIGLSNANARIVMLHGPDYGLQLHSIEGLGTEIIVWIPVSMEPAESESDKGANESREDRASADCR